MAKMVKNLLQCKRPGFEPWAGKIPEREEWQATSVFLPGKLHGQRSLAGYRPCDSKEPDTAEQLKRIWTDISPKKIYKWLTSTWKDIQHQLSLEKRKSKPQMDTTAYLPTRMIITKKTDSNKCWQDYGETEIIPYCWWECKILQLLKKTVWHFLKVTTVMYITQHVHSEVHTKKKWKRMSTQIMLLTFTAAYS